MTFSLNLRFCKGDNISHLWAFSMNLSFKFIVMPIITIWQEYSFLVQNSKCSCNRNITDRNKYNTIEKLCSLNHLVCTWNRSCFVCPLKSGLEKKAPNDAQLHQYCFGIQQQLLCVSDRYRSIAADVANLKCNSSTFSWKCKSTLIGTRSSPLSVTKS